MQGDFSRLTRYPGATRVLMQQGRVQLDADWNELVALVVRRVRELSADLVGPHGGPQGNLGYGLLTRDTDTSTLDDPEAVKLVKALKAGEFGFTRGRYYVGGWDCETPSLVYTAQPALPLSDAEKKLSGALWIAHLDLWGGQPKAVNVDEKSLLVYLDVWERHVCAAEDEALLDVALGGLDTATRAVLMAQVRVVPGPAASGKAKGAQKAAPTEEQLFAHLHALFPEDYRPRLKARAQQPPKDADPCLSDPDARYRGAENQLYRVEIHRGGPAGKATFKWSRDNGSVVFPVDDLSASLATLRHLGRDDRSTLGEGEWVELLDAKRARRGAPGWMAQAAKVDRDTATVTLTPASGVSLPAFADLERPILRRWDHQAGLPAEGGAPLDEGALVVAEADGETGWVKLEDGLEVQFQKPLLAPGQNERVPFAYRSGDYWLIPARTATGDVEWPRDANQKPLPAGPWGVRHSYAPLALVTLDAGGQVALQKDYRRAFEALAKPVA